MKILVIDDDVHIRGSICELLGLFDHELSEAGDGIEGLEVALRVQPDLILCDIIMPRMDGYAFFQALRENPTTAEIPVIFLGALNGPKEMITTTIYKPFTPEDLIEMVQAALDKKSGSSPSDG